MLLKYTKTIVFPEELLAFQELYYRNSENVSIRNLTSNYLNRKLLLVILQPNASVQGFGK